MGLKRLVESQIDRHDKRVSDPNITDKTEQKANNPRQIAANTKHGNETRAIREERSAKLEELYELEMLGRELGLISGSMVGRSSGK